MTSTDAYYKKMTETPVSKLIVSLGIPTTISMLVTSIYNMADTYFVGELGESQQAATGILFTLQAIIQAVAFMLGQGSGTMVSKALADKNKKEASQYVSTAFFTALAAGSLLMILGLIFIDPFMRLLGSTETILPYARQYGFWVLVAAPFMTCSFVLNNNLRYEGKSFYAMIGLVTGGIINIFGDYLLIRIFHMGVFGAGLSTAVSQLISFLMLLIFHRKTAQGIISIKHISKKLSVIASIARVGFPALIRQGLTSISNGLLNNLTKPFGDAAIAAMSVVNRYSMLVMCVGLGIGQGFQPVASFNYQAKRYDRVKKGLVFTMTVGFVLVGIMSIPGLIFPEWIVSLFQKEKTVQEIGGFALRCASIGVLFHPLAIPVNMLYQSIRKPGISSFLSMIRSGLMLIPTLIITTTLWGLTGIQISQPIADMCTGLISIPFIIAFLRKPDDKMTRRLDMNIIIRKFNDADLSQMIEIWNEIVEEGIAFPQEDLLTIDSGREFFNSQTYTGVAENSETGKILGLYILHPNNIGRCGHICNASYAVSSTVRGLHIGEKLVLDCMEKGKQNGFRVLQFNAVVATNIHARHLYERLGFIQLGTIKVGFRMKDGHYEDICPYYHEL